VRLSAPLDKTGQGRILHAMTAEPTSEEQPKKGADKDGKEKPDWANGLRQLYDSVVEEPLPDSFTDLLSQLDTKD
jgi:ABC-type uncharacterized transport system YnjBCD substrate-binding protein